jgi:hypothetical protein
MCVLPINFLLFEQGAESSLDNIQLKMAASHQLTPLNPESKWAALAPDKSKQEPPLLMFRLIW